MLFPILVKKQPCYKFQLQALYSQRKREYSKSQKALGFASTQISSKLFRILRELHNNWQQTIYTLQGFRNLVTCQLPYIVSCINRTRHELNRERDGFFQLHRCKGKKVRLIWDDRCLITCLIGCWDKSHLCLLVLRFWSSQQWTLPLKLGLEHLSKWWRLDTHQVFFWALDFVLHRHGRWSCTR